MAAVYFVSASAALQLTRFDGGVATVWLAGAVLFAKLSATPRRRWTGITLACVPAGLLASFLFGLQGVVAVPLPLVCIAEGYAAAWLMKRLFPRFGRFQSVPEVACFLAVAGVLVPACSALMGALCALVARGIPYGAAWRDWYAGHALGLVAFAPPLLLTLRGQARQWLASAGQSRLWEAFGLLVLVAAASLLTFGQNRIPVVMVPFLPMIAATVRLGRFGAVASIVILLTIGLSFSLAGYGPTTLLHVSMALKLQVLQIYFASIVLILLPLAAELRTRRRTLDRLHAVDALHRLVLDRSSDIIIRLGLDGTLRYVSPATERVWGYRPEELTDGVMFRLLSPEDLPGILETRRRALANPDETAIAEYRVIRKDGAMVWVESHMRATIDDHGRVMGTVSIVREVTGRRKLMEDLTRKAMTDPLTGAHNRRAFDETLSALLASVASAEVLGCLAVFDLDHFKQINDRYGHMAGDLVLARFVAILRSSMREGDLIARLGGEEFAVILGGMASDQAHLVCERVRKRFEQTAVQDASGAVIRTTVSVGIARLVPGQNGDDAMKKADEALYRAKQLGRNQSAGAA
ncbi:MULTISPECIES: diguanylate cyclase [unclassified Novosphingobium]|uniref:sensor domain-containing diguanylate cyclase n=1 Tax=unclassified Novosphingobium TaxID=2644732 RepID=UPI001F2778A9|nr:MULTISPECIES: diguanylate cyclase [unclassified Novosphingobium]